MITLKSPREIEAMAKSGAILAGMHVGLRDIIKPGISSWDIEEFARKYFKEHDAVAAQIGFEGYEYATCVSVNDEICHGFPRKNLILKEGDLVKVDTVVDYHGAFSDSCWSYVVGKANPEVERLMEVTKKRCILGSTKQKSVIGSATSGLRSKNTSKRKMVMAMFVNLSAMGSGQQCMKALMYHIMVKLVRALDCVKG